MDCQKSAEATVAACKERRAEHGKPQVSGGNTRTDDEGRKVAASDYPDGIGVAEFKDHLKQHWPAIKASLLAGSYQPAPVRRVDIPKPQGGTRTLGIPTLTDRLIQQALRQVLSPIFEAGFSESSYGFRPGRNAHQAVKAARQYVADGRRVVVDREMEKFFDRVNHDLLMEKLSKKIDDGRVLRLILQCYHGTITSP